MILDTVEAIPLMITWKRLALLDAVAELMIEAEDATPFTVEVRVFVAEVRELVVVGSSPTIEVLDIIPLTFVVNTPPA